MRATDTKKPRRRPVPIVPTTNLVTEIVDQITKKQERAVMESESVATGSEICDFCLEATRALPYRLVLKCAGDEPSS